MARTVHPAGTQDATARHDGAARPRFGIDVPSRVALCAVALALLPFTVLAQGGALALFSGLAFLPGVAGAVLLWRRELAGWQLARGACLLQAVFAGLGFLVCLASLRPGPGVTFLVLAVGLATVGFVAAFQQLQHTSVLTWLRPQADDSWR